MMMMINYPSCFFSRKKMFQLEQLKQPILQYSNAIRKKKSNVFFTFFFLGWMGLSIMSSTAIFLRPKFSNKWFFMVVSSKTKMKKSSVERRRWLPVRLALEGIFYWLIGGGATTAKTKHTDTQSCSSANRNCHFLCEKKLATEWNFFLKNWNFIDLIFEFLINWLIDGDDDKSMNQWNDGYGYIIRFE